MLPSGDQALSAIHNKWKQLGLQVLMVKCGAHQSTFLFPYFTWNFLEILWFGGDLYSIECCFQAMDEIRDHSPHLVS